MIRIRTRKDEAEQRRPGMRPLWSGTISFGLINVPVRLFPATRRVSLSLRMLDADGTPLRRRYYCPQEERIVDYGEVVRGFELDTGEFVLVEDEELEAIEPKKSREIDLRHFVDLARIPPLHFERAYFLTPAGDSNKAYRLLAEVMQKTGRAGIATFVMRDKEYLVAILADNGVLRAATLRFPDEIRDPEAAGLPPEAKVDRGAEQAFGAAIEALEADELDPDELTDDHAEQVRALARRKRKAGRDVVESPRTDAEEEEGSVDDDEIEEVDLLETIRINLRGGNRSVPASRS